MSSKNRKLMGLAGAAALVGQGALELAHHQKDPFVTGADYAVEILFAAGLLLTIAALFDTFGHVLATGTGRAGLGLATGGQALLGAIAAATAAHGGDVLGPLFPMAVLAWFAGSIMLAIAIRRGGGAARRIVVALPVAVLASIILSPGGAAVIGAFWLVVIGDSLRAPNVDPTPA